MYLNISIEDIIQGGYHAHIWKKILEEKSLTSNEHWMVVNLSVWYWIVQFIKYDSNYMYVPQLIFDLHRNIA